MTLTPEQIEYEYDDDEPLRCRPCMSSIFRIYRGFDDKGEPQEYAECCECGGSTIVTHLREDYEDIEK